MAGAAGAAPKPISPGEDLELSQSEYYSDDEEVPEEDKPNGEDIGHLELAWEVLELAKNISGKHGKTDIEAEALHYLGEVYFFLTLGSAAIDIFLGEFGEQ